MIPTTDAVRAVRAFERVSRGEVARQTRLVLDANVICVLFDAIEPVIEDTAVGERVHINAIGSDRRGMRELPLELLLRASLIAADQVEAAMSEAGELIDAIERRVLSQESPTEIGQIWQ